jgi:hypothetical protein
MMENTMNTPDRSQLHFVQNVRKSFSFLIDEGFTEIEALPTLVRYRNGNIEVNVYHGRLSYEVGCEVSLAGNSYPMSTILHVSDFEAASSYRVTAATTPEVLAMGIKKLSALLQRYGTAALRGDPHFFTRLEDQRKLFVHELALDCLEHQLRPQAADAFRRRDYLKAAELYGSFLERLSPVEVKKLALAEARMTSHSDAE